MNRFPDSYQLRRPWYSTYAADDTLVVLGYDGDIVMLLNSAAIAADAGDTDVPAVFKGASDHQATATNSLILANITSDGDILMLVNDGGVSKEFLHVDGATAVLTLGHGMAGVTVTPVLTATGGIADIGGIAGNDFGAAQLDLAAAYTILGANVLNINTTVDALVLTPATIVRTTKPIKEGHPLRFSYTINAVNAAVADNTAATILTFTVPLPIQNDYFTSANVTLQVTFWTRDNATGHQMLSTAELYMGIVRIEGRTALSSIELISAVRSDELGTDGSHATLAAAQFSMLRTAGSATESETWALQYTNDYDAGVDASYLSVTGLMHVLTNNVSGGIITVV